MSPEEEKVVRTLARNPEAPRTAGQLKASAAEVDALVGAGVVERLAPAKKGQLEKLRLTAQGIEAAQSLAPVRAPRAPRAKAAAGPTVKDLYELIVSLRDEVRAVLGRPPASAVPGAQEIDAALDSALNELDARGRHGGLVPIPDLRRELSPLGLTREAFDAALLERQRARTLDLKVANDPSLVDDPDGGIPQEGRGLLYYAVRR